MTILKAIRSGAMIMGVVATLAGRAEAAFVTVDDFSDIMFWGGVAPGVGVNEAGFVLQFTDGDDPTSIAWGYRWNGTASAEDMVFAIAGSTTISGGASPPPGLVDRMTVDGSQFDLGDGPVVFINSITYDQVGLPVEWSQVDRPLVGNYDEDGTFLAIYVWPGASGVWNQGLANSSFQASDFGISELVLASGNWYALGLATVVDPWPAPPIAPVFTQPVSAVPEPGTWVLGAGAVVATVALRRRLARRS